MALERKTWEDSDTKEPLHSFVGAVKKAEELEEIIEENKNTKIVNKGGRPIKGNSIANKPIRFVIDEELDAWLESLTSRHEKTPSAVVKKILIAQYELNNKK